MKLMKRVIYLPLVILFAQSALASHALDSIYSEEFPKIHQEQDDFTTVSPIKPTHSNLTMGLFKLQYWSGSVIHYSSWAMGVGGVLLALSHGHYNGYNIQLVGAFSLLGSIPVNGIGSTIMATAVNQMAQDTIVNYKQGWYLYGSSILCLALGGLSFIGGLDALDSDESYSDSDDENPAGAIIGGGLLFVFGALAHVTSWFYFNEIARNAQEENSYHNVSISPTILPTNTGNIAPGVALTLTF